MNPTLDFSHPPLALLNPEQRQRFDRACDIVLFPRGDRPLREGQASAAVYFVIKGHAQAVKDGPGGEQRLSDYGPGDVLGAFAVMQGAARFTYEVIEDLLCHSVDAAVFAAALAQNPAFLAWFQEGLAAKRQLLAAQDQPSDLAETMLTRVVDAQLAPALRMPATASLREARQAMKTVGVSCVLVERDRLEDPGIVTRTDVLDALALEGASADTPIAAWVRHPLIAVEAGEMLFHALVKMTERHVERVVVRDGAHILGTLGLAEVLSHYSSHSHLIGLQLARAEGVADVRAAARRIPELVRVLHAQGAKMAYLMELVSALNTRIMRRLYELLIPVELQPRMCLLVLGSEGRREQILRTDQDNALLLEDGLDEEAVGELMQRYSAALLDCGFPPCPGRVMVDNPHWRGTVATWQRRLQQMAQSSDPERLLELAVLIDARPVAGQTALFDPLQPLLLAAAGNDIVLHHFAAAALSFATPLSLFGRLKSGEHGLDIKKGGIFPLVHGLRTLALKHALTKRNSFARAEALRAVGALSEGLARDVQQALAVFVRLRLGQQLAAEKRGETPDNLLRLDQLRRLDRDLLRDALAVVEAFKGHLRQQFQR